MDNAAILSLAQKVMETEIEGLRTAQAALGDDFLATVRLLAETLDKGGKIVVTGVGKNLHIAEKLSATLASTGSTSVVMNPIQAMHGDLGIIAGNDVLLALSFSGESEEVIKLIPAVRRLGITVIGMVGNPDSTLARLSDVVLCVRIGKEACPFGMAPTTSTTATLAVGDALAMVLIDAAISTRRATPASTPPAPSAAPSSCASATSCAPATASPASPSPPPSWMRSWP